MEVTLAIDCGKAMTKVAVYDDNAVGSIKTSCFNTNAVGKTGMEDTGLINAHKVKYNGVVMYVGGQETEGDTSNQNSKNDDIHKFCTLYAIASNVNNGDTVNVVIGCPLSVYANKEQRDKYKSDILPKGRVEISIDDKPMFFNINKRLVCAESTGIIALSPELFEEDTVIFDIGGLNVNAVKFVNQSLVANSCITSKLGMKTIKNNIKSVCEKALQEDSEDFELDEVQLEGIIKRGYVLNYKSTTEDAVKDTLNEHINAIAKDCEKKWKQNVKTYNQVFVGGTSLLLKDSIKNRFPDATIVEDALYSNAKGFLITFLQRLGIEI